MSVTLQRKSGAQEINWNVEIDNRVSFKVFTNGIVYLKVFLG